MAAWIIFVVVAVVIGTSMLAMAVGVLARRPCLRGSCGGPPVRAADGTRLSCDGCPRRAAALRGPR
jgi:hypothetical protein